ncbi:MAG: ABC transporter substrate-binding protein [Enterocloster sp.]|nr:ABC transporter substrate-binding protein [Enterocloster sp.]MBP8869281.1 ABC transporter substrate-binding protein [Enterocloster sp.]MBS5086298.1 ABC transporter substrate-binding protein [Clostridiaceae bacterium]
MALTLAAGSITGCSASSAKTETAKESMQSQAETKTAEQSTQAEKTSEAADAAGEREITDMAGRTVVVPDEIETVFSSSTVTAIFMYTLAPDKLLGWNYELNELEKSIILEEYHDLPNFGMGDSINYEAVIAADPTIAVNVGTINDKMISDCDKLSKSLGVPVVAVDGDLSASAEAYRFMGELLGEEEQAEKLASYAEKTFADIEKMEVPEDKKVRIYYGNGEDSLETAPAGSAHGQIIDMVNAVNVADLEMGEGSRVQISAEQLLAWDPDVIVVNGEPKADTSGASAAEAILANPDYASLKAVQDQQVYGTPNTPFSWMDRPMGPNRIVGIRWLSGLIYPEYLNYNVDEEVKEFFDLFYHVQLTDEKLENIYSGTV